MQAAVLPSHPAESPGVVAARPRLELFDDPQEWLVFSRCVDESAGAAGIWESQLVVRGMHCSACALAIEESLAGVKGVLSVRVNAASARASVTWHAGHTLPSAWMAAPLARGYSLLPASDAFGFDQMRQDARLMLWRWLVAGFCMMQVMMYAAPAYFSAPGEISSDIQGLLRWASWVLSLPVVFFSCGPFFSNAWRDLRQGSISMDLPVALGIAMTFAVSTAATFEPQGWWGREVFFDSLTMFVFFLLTGRWLEQRLRASTAGALESLMQRLPASVERKLGNGLFERIAVRRLRPGDVVRVLPGEAFPADGSIVAGNTFADEALLTGESRPVARQMGEGVFAGSYNLSQAVEVAIEQTGQATRYAQIVALMEQAALDKPRLALLADRVARPFLCFVLIAAAAACVAWWSTDPSRALMAAVAVLVVTCPCALSLAAPGAMLASAGLLARHGVLVRRLQAIESLADIDTVIFDKTGTLTESHMGLHAVQVRAGLPEAEALALAALLARHSLHPASRALVLAAGDASPPAGRLLQVREVAGHGLEADFESATASLKSGSLRLGSARFCGVQGWPAEGVQVYLADSQGWLARFELGESLRADAAQAIAALKAAGVQVHLLSGDRQSNAQRLAGRLGIEHVQGDCTPEAKLERLRLLQQQGRKVLMAGDGLNDGPVLAGAHVSIAIGSAVPLAQARSDFVMPGVRLLMLPAMLVHARQTMRIVRQNLCWAAAYNALCVPLALAGWLPAWLAGLGMALSSLLVIANAARLSKFSETLQEPR